MTAREESEHAKLQQELQKNNGNTILRIKTPAQFSGTVQSHTTNVDPISYEE